MKLGELIAQLRKNPKTRRAGLKWDVFEYDQLLQEVYQNKSISEIAEIHQRLPSSILYHCYVLAMVMIINGLTPHEASELLRIDEKNLAEFCDKSVLYEHKYYYITNAGKHQLTDIKFDVIKIKN